MEQNGPKAPDDEKLKITIETLAKEVAKRGKEFEQKCKEKHQGKKSYPTFVDEGKEFNDYYKHRVNISYW